MVGFKIPHVLKIDPKNFISKQKRKMTIDSQCAIQDFDFCLDTV